MNQPPADDLDPILNYLTSDDLDQRRQASIALSQRTDERLHAPLLRALHDEDSTVRANVISAIGVNRIASAVPDLITILQTDASEIVRERAVTALAQLGTPAVLDALMQAMDDASAFVRNRAIYVLGASRDVRVLDALLEALDHPQASTQGVAAWALGALGDVRAFDPLCGLLDDADADVRGNVAWALGELGDARAIPRLLPLLHDPDPQVRGKTAWALGALGEATGDTSMVKPLIDLLDDFTEVRGQSNHVFVCQYAAEALAQIGDESAQSAVMAWRPRAQTELIPHQARDLLRYLMSDDRHQRQASLEALVQLGIPAVPILLKGARHQHVRVRQGCVQALGNLHDSQRTSQPPTPETLTTLIEALADEDGGVWSQATASLAKIGALARHHLTSAQTSPHERTRLGAHIALWRSERAESAFHAVLLALQDADELVRSSAITSLWLQPDERALASLQIQLEREEGMLAQYIIQALHALGTDGAHATIRHWIARQPGDAP